MVCSEAFGVGVGANLPGHPDSAMLAAVHTTYGGGANWPSNISANDAPDCTLRLGSKNEGLTSPPGSGSPR